jgi:catechol 2,3-dioxygenase-like lactoylglutathione lyase family enzyme
MATTTFREDFLGRDLVAPTVNSLDFLGTATTATVDRMGRALRRVLRANTVAVTLGQELQFAGGTKYTVTVAGTTAASEPSPPAVGATVADGTATLLRTK